MYIIIKFKFKVDINAKKLHSQSQFHKIYAYQSLLELDL